MRNIVVTEFVTLDGVMQAPGGPESDFAYGGWSAAYYDHLLDAIAEKQKTPPKDFLLGRKTFEMFANFFPTVQGQQLWPGNNDITKYVVSKTLTMAEWKNTVFLESVEAIKTLKHAEGSDLQVSGSGQLVQTLFNHDLVDELWLLIHPLTLGTGNTVFANGTIPAAFNLVECIPTASGVICAHYQRDGEVTLGIMGG